MKIKRVVTKSFAVSESAEKICELRATEESPIGALKRAIGREKIEIKKAYRPLARFKISRQEEEHKGFITTETIYKVIDNFFYVDLTSLDIYHFPHRLPMESVRIDRYDILKRIIDLPDISIKTLGKLMRTDWIFYDELDRDAILDLETAGLIKTFKPSWKVLISTLWSEFNPEDDEILVKKRVKINYNIPKFRDPGWDLSSFLQETNTILESYERDKIKYSIERISDVLSLLFDARVGLEGVTFLPYIQTIRKRVDEHMEIKPKMHFPVCRIGIVDVKVKKGEPLRPIAIGTAIGSKGTVPVEEVTINFDDVANLEDVKEEIRKNIVYPLTKPELAKEFGKRGGGAILLYGPPGCGKTYIAKATVGECGVTFFNVNISDIISKGVEEGAKSLHEVFVDANRNSPAIIFFDELDAIGGRRVKGRSYAEKMEIDQFLMEMDGIDSLDKDVLVMAATNVPWNIDPALRRSVRFTKHIFIPPPDFETRIKLFEIHTRNLPVSDDIDFRKLAELTEGYSSSDIKVICDRAAEIPWREALKSGKKRNITMKDFMDALSKQKSSLIPWFKIAAKEIRESGERDIFKDFSEYILKYGGGIDKIRKPEITFADVGNLEDVKEEIRKNIVYPLIREDLAKEFKKETGSILLYGPPGCGKTYIAKATVGECNVSFFDVKITDIISSEEGRSEKNIREIFEKANKNAPAILFFDEIDAIAVRRDLDITGMERRIVDILLEELENSKKNKKLMVLAATNSPWTLDPSIKRAGRFSKKILVSRPNERARLEIFKVHTRDMPIDRSVDFERLSKLTEGYSSADIKEICDRAAEIPWREALEGGKKRNIMMHDFMSAIKSVKTSLAPWYSLAKKQILESDERDEYKELLEDIERFEEIYKEKERIKEVIKEERKRLRPTLSRRERERITALEMERDKVERMISKARFKYHKRQIDEATLRNLVEEYEKRVIDIEVELENLLERRKRLSDVK